MIITRTPLRVSLGGGGTDLPSYYKVAGQGFVIAGAISRHVYIAINQHFDDDIFLKYSRLERVPDAGSVQHPLLREALRLTGVERHVEISSMADLPADTGLGSSGAFTVGLLKALHAHRRDVRTNFEIASEACHIEIGRLGDPVGKQDQFISAIGGVTAFEFNADETVTVIPVPMTDDARSRFEENLLLFFTGIRRSASHILADQDSKSKSSDSGTKQNLDRVQQIGKESFDALSTGNFKWFSELMTEQWELKRNRSPGATTEEIDSWINSGLDAGALGGKLVGAGGGGFLMFYSENKADLRDAMSAAGLREIRFSFDYEGSKTLVID